MSCVYHGRTKADGEGVVATYNRAKYCFTDRSMAVFLLWFTISVIACLCMYAW